VQISPYELTKLPVNKLFETYLKDFEKLSDFFTGDPHEVDSLVQQARQIEYKYPRSDLITCLTEFNKQFRETDQLLENIKRFNDDKAVAIVTGQQLNMMGGPLMIVFKTLTAIFQARLLEKEWGHPVVPVFWLGDEDHDYDEISNVTILNRDSYRTFKFETPEKQQHAVADLILNGQIDDFKQQIRDSMFKTDFTDELWKMLDDCYKSGVTFSRAFGNMIAHLFADHGLVLSGSNSILIKDHIKDGLICAVKHRKNIEEKLQHSTDKVDREFHQQVKLSGSNLFYLHPEKGRFKINLEGDIWSTETGESWNSDKLIKEIENNPHCFSPNVFLRPVLQDYLLPTAGYVAGPGEVSYYAQMKDVYPVFDLRMPVILPRFNATVIESAIDRIINKLPFQLHEYLDRIEDLETRYIKHKDTVNLDRIFGEWKQKIQVLSDEKANVVAGIDPTLKKSVGSAKAVYFGELDKIKGKLNSSMKKNERIQMDRIARIKEQLFPKDSLQEREVASIYFMNKYGLDIWDKLLNNLEPEYFKQHNLVYL